MHSFRFYNYIALSCCEKEMRLMQLKMKSFLTVSLYFFSMMLVLILLSSVVITSVTYGQNFPNAQASNTNGTSSTLEKQQQSTPSLHLVKITSPTKNQQVATGKDLTITGTSGDNSTSDCKVSVIVNGIKPYRVAFPNGEAGGGDYSKWNYTLTPAYTNIKQGQNKITAKFSCSNDPNLISHNSVNVTGLAKGLTQISNQQLEQPYVGKNYTSTNPATTTTPSASSGNTTTSFLHSGVTYLNNGSISSNPPLRIMSVSIHVARSVHPSDTQTIAIKVSDKNSTEPIIGASVFGRITEPDGGIYKKFDGRTDDTGKATYSWTVSDGDSNGKYNTMMEVSASGYENSTGSKTFKISPVPATTSASGDNSIIRPSPPNGDNSDDNNNNNNNQNHPSTIIHIPHIHIPTIKIPFHLPFH
jgi:hypothetical protein